MNRVTTVGRVVLWLGRKFGHVWLSREWRVFFAAICLVAAAKPVAAITFNLTFVADATNPNDPTGSRLMSIMQEAANRWADIIEDSHTMTLNVSYYVNDASGNGPCGMNTMTACAPIVSDNAAQNRTVVGDVLFFANRNWYIDPTPNGDTEFNFTQTLHRDLTPAQQTAGFSGLDIEPLLEVGFRALNNGSDPNVTGNFDMLGTALHEIGHHLGVTNQFQAAQNETADDDYDLPPSLLAGANMAAKSVPPPNFHLVDAFPLMSNVGPGTGTRRLPAAVDVLAAAAVSGWSQIDLRRKDFLSGAFWQTAANWEGNRVPDNQDDAFVRHGGSVGITAVAGVANLLVGGTSQLTVLSTLSAAQEIRVTSGATMTVGIGGMVANTASYVGFDAGTGTLMIEDGGDVSNTFAQVATGENSDGAVTVTGAGSTWTNSSTLHVGYDGTGSLTISTGGAVSNITARLGFRVGSEGAVTVTGAGSTWTNSSTLHVGNTGTGSLIISAAGAVSAVDGRVGSFAGSEGAVIVTGAGSTWTTSSLSVGGTPTLSGGTGTLDVLSGGLVQASGNTVVWDNGDIDLRDGGTLNANGNVTIDDGVLTRASAGTFSLAAGKTMSVQNGGRASFDGSYNTASNAIYNITGSGSRLEAVSGNVNIINGAQVNVTSGGSLFATATIQVGFSNGTNGTLIVDGLGSSATTPGASAAIWGFGGATGTVTFQNNASGSFSQVSLAHSTTAGTAGNVTIQSGADLTLTSNLSLAALGGATTSAVLSVQGSGSTVTQTGGSALTVGHSATGTAAINIGTTSSGAVFDTGTGLTTINKTGTVTVGSGANTGTLNADGNVSINGGVLTRGSGSLFNLAAGKTMTITGGGRASFTGSYTSPSNAIYNVSSANSKLESINNNLNVNSGSQLNVNSGGLVSAVGVNVGTSGAGSLIVDGSPSTVTAIGSSFWGHSNATSNVTFRNAAVGTLAELRLANDPVANDVVVVNIESGADLNVGNLSLAVFGGGSNATLNVNDIGSTATQTGTSTLTIGHASSGLAAINIGTSNSGGVFTTGTGATIINKTGTVTVGSGANTGTLNANGNITIDGGLLQVGTGSRVIVAPVKSMTLINSGTLKGSGSVSGTVANLSGVVSPGTSPGTLSIDGNYTQNAAGQLLIELASASSFDTLVTTDFISLAGTLDVDLLGGFIPQPGTVFQIISASDVVVGTFGSVLFPTLTGANWQLRYNPNSVLLQVALVGDYNFNGTVDAADYVVWRKSLGQTGAGLFADGNGNDQIDMGDYGVWRAHFGQTAGSGSGDSVNATIPEPATLMLLMFAAAAWCLRRGQHT